MDTVINSLSVQNKNRIEFINKVYKLYSVLSFTKMNSFYQVYYLYKLYKFLKKYKRKKGYKGYKSKSSNNIKMEVTNEVISSLKFIGKLKKGEKINTKFMYTQPDGFFTRLSRTFINHDNRNNTLNFVQRTITNSFDIISKYEKSEKKSDIKMLSNIINDLQNAKTGLKNLKETYSEDTKFGCDISTLLQSIDNNMGDVIFEKKVDEVNIKNKRDKVVKDKKISK